jgi:hypothetical protein
LGHYYTVAPDLKVSEDLCGGRIASGASAQQTIYVFDLRRRGVGPEQESEADQNWDAMDFHF